MSTRKAHGEAPPALVRLIFVRPAEERGVNLDSVPEILQPQIFIGGVLVVIVIRDRESDDRRVVGCWKRYMGMLPPTVGKRTGS